MEIRNLITFTKVAETQSLSKAAKVLGYAQSTVTMQMQQLEQELGAQLYERVGKQIRITQTGQEFLSYATAIVRMSEDALMIGKQTAATVSGSLRLGILSPLAGPEISRQIAQYLQKYPQVNLQAETVQDPELLLSRLRHNEIDLALTFGTQYADEDLMHATEDQLAPLHLYVGREHPLAGQQSLSSDELSPYPLIHTGYFEAGHESSVCAASRQINISDPGLALFVVAGPCRNSQHNTGRTCMGDNNNDIEFTHSTDVESACSAGIESARGTDMESTCSAGMANTSGDIKNAMVLAPEVIVRQHPAAEQLIPLDYEISTPRFWVQVLYHRNKWLTGAMKAWISSLETG